MLSIKKNFNVDRLLAPQAAGTGTKTPTALDMLHRETALFVVGFGAIVTGSVITIKLQGSTDDSTFVDIEGSSITVADDQDNKLVLLECIRPKYRYVRPLITIATQNATIDLVTAISGIYQRNAPVTQGSTVSTTMLESISKDAGTA